MTSSPSPLSLIFAAGGSGGHLFPAVAVAEAIRGLHPDASLTLVSSMKAIDATVTAQCGVGWETLAIPARPPGEFRTAPWRTLRDNWRAWREASRLLDTRRPNVIVGCGGFASFPTLLAARRRRIPILLLEQNALPGRVTRWCAPWAETICCAFPQALDHLKSRRAITTGNPVRLTIQFLREAAATLEASTPTLLVLGGSQGAHGINAGVAELARARPQLFAGWNVVHQTGERDRDAIDEAYRTCGVHAEVVAFTSELPRLYGEASLVISRAGATTLAELACARLPSILVPYPQAADDHQRANAKVFAEAGASLVIEQSGPDFPRRLAEALEPLLTDETMRRQLSDAAGRLGRPEAAGNIADRILRLAAGQDPAITTQARSAE